MAAGESRKTVVIALTANAVIAVAKLFGVILSGSAALFAETAHSVADTTNQVFLLISLRMGSEPPDDEHPSAMARSASSGPSWPPSSSSSRAESSRSTVA